MKRYIPHIVISLAALLLAMGHTIFPSVKVDAVTVTLLLVAVLPWLGSIFKSVELPGGLKIEYPDLEKARADAEKAGLIAPVPTRKMEPAYVSIALEDPNLALAGLRIEIERRLRTIATARGFDVERRGISQILRLLRSEEILSSNEDAVLMDLVGLLNGAVHGAEVDPRAEQWAIEIGPRLLGALDERIPKEGSDSNAAS